MDTDSIDQFFFDRRVDEMRVAMVMDGKLRLNGIWTFVAA
jgi:hypothetical protein